MFNDIFSLDASNASQDIGVATKIIKEKTDIITNFIFPSINVSINNDEFTGF